MFSTVFDEKLLMKNICPCLFLIRMCQWLKRIILQEFALSSTVPSLSASGETDVIRTIPSLGCVFLLLKIQKAQQAQVKASNILVFCWVSVL